jgi:cysteinyl-tRNA synthetase
VGSVLTVSVFKALTCNTETIVVGNVTYYRCGTTWYSRAHQGGSVTYVVVAAPAGY